MAKYSQNFNLELPDSPEKYNIQVFNKNAMVIDSELHKLDLKNQSQDKLLATKESLNSEISRATEKETEITKDLESEVSRAEEAENNLSNDIISEANRAIMSENQIQEDLSEHIANELNPHKVTAEQLGLENVDNTADIDKPVSMAQQSAIDLAVSNHNTSAFTHDDIRDLITCLTTRLNALADSDDITLDQLSEIVAYIKNNKSLIDGITTSKINVSDIIDDLDSTLKDKVLSSNQGRVLKEMIISLTKADIGLGNVENKSSATIRGELTKENVTSALGYTPPTTNTTYSASNTTPKANGTASAGSETEYARGDHIHPSQTSVSGNAGTATKWQTARTLGCAGDVVGTVSVDGTANKSATVTRRGCIVGQSSSTITNPYYKFASISISSGNYDTSITFHVTWGYGDNSTKLGILTAHVRTTSDGKWASGQLVWESATNGIDISKFRLAHNTANPCIIELWAVVDIAYVNVHFDVISEGTRTSRNTNLWTLYNTLSVGSSSAITSGYTVQNSTLSTLKNPTASSNVGITYSDSEPTSLIKNMTWIGN